MVGYPHEMEKLSRGRNTEYEMRDVPTPQTLRTPSLWSFDESTVYEPDHVYERTPYDRSPYGGSSPYNRSPTPTSSYAFGANHSNSSTARLTTPQSKYVKRPISVPRAQKFASDFTTFSTTYPDSAYTIEVTGKRDDIDYLPTWRRRLYRLSPFTTLLSVGAYWAYFGLRILYTIYAQRTYNELFIMAWFFITAEMIVAFPAIFHQLWQLTAFRSRKRKQIRLRGDVAPSVNVLVTCCKEEVDVIIDTVRAACSVDYPRDRFRVTVCDDGADPELRAAVEYLRLSYPNLYYHARVKIKGVPHHFKAGNLIAATDFVASLEGGQSEYLAALDADMIPEPEWLRAVIAHMAIDPKLALACPPQLFYNVPDNDPLTQSLDGFVHNMETVKDASGVAWCTGSGYAIRISALESIGGWPTGSLAEDVCTSSMLLGRGWRTAYVHEPLQWGTVPEDLVSHLKQRTRWTLGTLQTAKKLNFFFFGKDISKMTFFQRLSGFVFAIDAFFKIFFVVSIMTFPVVLISGKTMVAYSNTEQLRMQVRFCFAALVLQRINEFCMALPAGYRQLMRESTSMLWMAPYHAMTVIRSFILPKWLGGKVVAFTSSGSLGSVLNERNPAARAGLGRRLVVILWNCKAYLHLLYILFVIVAVTMSTIRAFTTQHTTYDTLVYLITHAAWPPLLWLITIVAFFTPLHYAIWPPNMPDREDLLDRNMKTGVAHPKEEWKRQRWNGFSWFYELQYSLLTAFTALIFAATFLIGNALPDVPAPGGSIGFAPPTTPKPTGPVQLCGQYEAAASNSGQYIVETNQWGMDSSGAQCLVYDPDRAQSNDVTSFTVTWSWTESINNVHSYPNAALESDNLPAQLSTVNSLEVDVSWTMGMGNTAVSATNEASLVDVKANVPFDCFLDADKTKAQNASLADFEFMVWLAQYGGTQPLGWGADPATLPTHSLGGESFTLYSALNQNGQMVHSWYPSQNIPTFTGDISELLRVTMQVGNIPDTAYLGIVQFGTETTHSTTNVTFDASNVSMQLNVK